jgi:hypothetical protein
LRELLAAHPDLPSRVSAEVRSSLPPSLPPSLPRLLKISFVL